MKSVKNILQEAYLKDLNIEPLLVINQSETVKTRFEELQNKFSDEAKSSAPFEELVKELLVIAIVDEQLAELNYLQSYNLSETEGKSDFDPEFENHEVEESNHKRDLIERLRELDSKQIFTSIDQWIYINSRGTDWKQEFSHNSFDILKNRLKEEEEAVEFYTLCVNFLRGTDDTTTYTLFKKIKEDEEEHVKDLRDLAREHGILTDTNNTLEFEFETDEFIDENEI